MVSYAFSLAIDQNLCSLLVKGLNLKFDVVEVLCVYFVAENLLYVWVVLCYLYAFTQLLCHWEDVTQDQFLSRVLLAWTQFSFSLASCLTKAKELGLLYSLPITVGRRDELMPFSKGINTKWNANSHVLELNSGHQFHFLRISYHATHICWSFHGNK